MDDPIPTPRSLSSMLWYEETHDDATLLVLLAGRPTSCPFKGSTRTCPTP